LPVFEHPEFARHERVVHVCNEAVGLRAIIAIHDRTLGPAIGGCRIFPYASEDDALTDVLRLSKGMTYKNALAGLPFGGGKSVIIIDPSQKSPQLFEAYAEALNSFDGQYRTGEDVNFGPSDVEVLARYSPYVMGKTIGESVSGDPSPHTAAGVFAGMKAALRQVFGSGDLSERRVAIQGVGNVGFELARLVTEAGGSVVVTDVRAESTQRAAEELGAQTVALDAIYDEVAPCAMGGTINEESVPRLKARIVCGAANNQLSSPAAGRRLVERGITYAPDYVVNAGGILNASGEFFGNYDPADARRKVNGIEVTTSCILETAAREKRPSHEVADEMAESILAAARQNRLPAETN
jgi:leucine dehydrogenase